MMWISFGRDGGTIGIPLLSNKSNLRTFMAIIFHGWSVAPRNSLMMISSGR